MITVIICTYNRASILEICLENIIQANDISKLELIVVDNNSTDNTKDVVSQFPQFRYILETNLGLSNARNRGMDEAHNDWLFFLDDDAKVKKNIFEQAKFTINNYDFKMFTGIYKAWYDTTPPKWLPSNIGNYLLNDYSTIASLNKYQGVSGNVMVVHKPTLIQESLYFPTHLGMSGGKMGYGEETYVEHELRWRNIRVGINPNMIIYHLVASYKFKLKWILKAAFYQGKSNPTKHSIGYCFLILSKQFPKIIFYLLWHCIKGRKTYEVVHSLQVLFFFLGNFMSKYKFFNYR